MRVVQQLLRDEGHPNAAALLAAHDAELLHHNQARIEQAQTLMRQFGLQGVPALILSDAHGSRALPGQLLYGNVDNLLREIAEH